MDKKKLKRCVKKSDNSLCCTLNGENSNSNYAFANLEIHRGVTKINRRSQNILLSNFAEGTDPDNAAAPDLS